MEFPSDLVKGICFLSDPDRSDGQTAWAQHQIAKVGGAEKAKNILRAAISTARAAAAQYQASTPAPVFHGVPLPGFWPDMTNRTREEARRLHIMRRHINGMAAVKQEEDKILLCTQAIQIVDDLLSRRRPPHVGFRCLEGAPWRDDLHRPFA